MPRKNSQAQQQEQQQDAPTREPGDESPAPARPQRGWKHSNEAGVERLSYTDSEEEIYEFWLKFRDGKPTDKVRQYMKDNGFHWESNVPSGGQWPAVDGAWVRPIAYKTRNQDRLHGERVFEKIVQMICAEKGIEAPQLEVESF